MILLFLLSIELEILSKNDYAAFPQQWLNVICSSYKALTWNIVKELYELSL